ncbi:MAG: peptide MFS transporter [Bacteroidales bacterium]|jgi:POT family proton-dependent oligopeptide transporter
MNTKQERVKTKHPGGLYLISFTSIWERFSYYGMRAFLILYMANDILKGGPKAHLGGLGLSETLAGSIYGIFTGSCYILPILGGWLADRYIGKRRSVLIGGIFIMIGHFTLAGNFYDNFAVFILGLTLVAIGNGFFKPSAPTMIGDLYEQGDKRRDSAFTIYYFLFNGGAFLAPIVCGYFGETYLYRWGFFVAGVGMLLGLLLYIIFQKKYLGDIGLKPVKVKTEGKREKTPLTKIERDRISVIVVLAFFVTFFWAGFEQAGSTLNLYADKYIDKTFFGWEMPTSWLQSVNPVFIVLLGPVFSALWMRLGQKGKNPPSPIKMGLGMIALAIGFVFMIGAVMQRGADNTDITVKASIWWLIATYFMHTVGELMLSPIGLSLVTKLAPVRMAALFMGVWYLSSFIANNLSGISVHFVNKFGALTIFSGIAIFVGLLGVTVLFLSRWLIGRMHGVE